MKKCLAALVLLVLLLGVSPAYCADGVWAYRRTMTVSENAGVARHSYPIDLFLSKAEFAPNAADLRITNAKGDLLPYQVVGVDNNNFTIRVSCDLAPKGKQVFHIYSGNPGAQAPNRPYVGAEKFIGDGFLTLAFGEVRISSYTKDNRIEIFDQQNKYVTDIYGRTITPEVFQPGGMRAFTLAKPTVLKITSTSKGLMSVAVGSFDQGETDCTAFIAGDALVYVPQNLAITSLHDNNKVRVKYRVGLAKEQTLQSGQTLVFDGLSPGLRKVEADYDCVIQYGTFSAFSMFAAPQRGLVYSFLPLGKTIVTSCEDNTTIDVVWSDETKPSETRKLENAGQTITLDTPNPLKPKVDLYKATTITSDKPITVLVIGNAGSHGATLLPGKDGRFLSKSWFTTFGPIDPKNPVIRQATLISPYSDNQIEKYERNIFPQFPQKASFATSTANTSAEFSSIVAKTKQYCLMLEGRTDDKATLFQVPALLDRTVVYTLSDPILAPEGQSWTPETPPQTKPPDQAQKNWFARLWGRLVSAVQDPKGHPLEFALFLLGIAIILLVIALIVWRKPKEPPKPPKCDPKPAKPEPKTAKKPKEAEYAKPAQSFDWKDLGLEDEGKEKAEGAQDIELDVPAPLEKRPETHPGASRLSEPPMMRTPKLKAPNIQKFLKDNKMQLFDDIEERMAQEHKEEEPVEGLPKPGEQPLVIQPPSEPEPEPPPEPPQFEVRTAEYAAPVSVNDEHRSLADQMNNLGVVADPGAIMRLYKEGLLNLFSKVYVSHTAASLLPTEIASEFEKVPVIGKDAEKASKIASDLGVFEEVGRALVVAEKMKLGFYLTSARLPDRLGKLKVVSIDRFC